MGRDLWPGSASGRTHGVSKKAALKSSWSALPGSSQVTRLAPSSLEAPRNCPTVRSFKFLFEFAKLHGRSAGVVDNNEPTFRRCGSAALPNRRTRLITRPVGYEDIFFDD